MENGKVIRVNVVTFLLTFKRDAIHFVRGGDYFSVMWGSTAYESSESCLGE